MSIICVHSKCSMLPDQRVGCCSCTCRESTRPMRATTIFLLCAFWHIGKNLLCKMLACKKSFLLPQEVVFQLVWQKKWSFMICITTCSLIHLFMLMSMQSVIHIHTHTLTHTMMKHTMHHTLHTQIHMIYAIAQHA